MQTYRIHPIVMGTKIFDKTMMTYQHGAGTTYTIPIYCWYLEGGEQTILVDTGELSPIQSEDRERAIGGKIHTFESGLARWGLEPGDIDMEVIPPGTHVNAYEAYDILTRIKSMADILIPLHEPRFAAMDTIPS